MYYVLSDNNVKIAVYDPNPAGNPSLLMLHGWPLCSKMYEYQIKFLTARGFRCVTMDFRGFGQSDAPGEGYGYTQMARDVCAVVQSLNVPSVVLAGFSMGGAIAIRCMSLFSGYKVSKLALLSTAAPSYTIRPGYPFGTNTEATNELIDNLRLNRPKAIRAFGENFFAKDHGEDFDGWFYRLNLEASPQGTTHGAMALRDEDLRADMANIHVPTGILHGKKT